MQILLRSNLIGATFKERLLACRRRHLGVVLNDFICSVALEGGSHLLLILAPAGHVGAISQKDMLDASAGRFDEVS